MVIMPKYLIKCLNGYGGVHITTRKHVCINAHVNEVLLYTLRRFHPYAFDLCLP